jgi:hypothetical protein
MVHLITQFYQVKYDNQPIEINKARQLEITNCLKNNINHDDIEKIHFLYESYDDVEFMELEGIIKNHPKLILYNLGHRLTYHDVFKYCNTHLDGKVCVYAHSDMSLQDGFNLLTSDNINPTKIYCLTAHNINKCTKQFKCNCVRQFVTPKGIYTPTVDGIVFKGGTINEKATNDCNHIMHRMGSENRMISILKREGYDVVCPNNILYALHVHYVKIFAQQHNTWIEMSGECKPLEYYQKIHCKEEHMPYDKKIVGGGIPFYDGTAKLVNEL